MILSDVKRYMIERRQATLSDIALHFKASPEAVRGMLDYWIRKGKVSKQMATASCGTSCNRCVEATTEIYLWQEGRVGDIRIESLPGDCTEHH
ncbi:MAG TPA: sugar metabolism transcriptional regulator [Gammaproteobacteria bacterium]|nr:sugar metabolism transcriptional regulator [Gammaproteobacteria bacterium]